jgi:hypothetical protein
MHTGDHDILSLLPAFSTRRLNALFSSSPIFRNIYNPTEIALQQYNGTGRKKSLDPSPATPSVAHSSCGFHTFQFCRLTERGVNGIIR